MKRALRGLRDAWLPTPTVRARRCAKCSGKVRIAQEGEAVFAEVTTRLDRVLLGAVGGESLLRKVGIA